LHQIRCRLTVRGAVRVRLSELVCELFRQHSNGSLQTGRPMAHALAGVFLIDDLNTLAHSRLTLDTLYAAFPGGPVRPD
jgi:hypothetical protein